MSRIHKFTITSTATGGSTAVADYDVPLGSASAQAITVGSTKNIAYTLQGRIGQSATWQNISAATTATTGTWAHKPSTATMTFNQLRINVTANATTGNATLTVWTAAR